MGPNVAGNELVFGVAHILSTWNDTFIHITDLTGRETLARVTGGMKVKSDREESSPYAAMQAAKDVYEKLKTLKINALHIKLRARGGILFELYNKRCRYKTTWTWCLSCIKSFGSFGTQNW